VSEAMRTLRAEPLRRFKRYPAYKDSGVWWLGQIPFHWTVARIGEFMSLINGYPFDSEYFVRGEGVPLVRIRDLNSTETEVNYVGPVIDEAWIEAGDVIIGMDGDFNVARWRGPKALLNQRMCCVRPRSGANAGFVTYLLPLPLKVINDLTYSTTVKHLSSHAVRKIRFGAPPESEQRAIAAFLDRETARVDALVAKKEQLIELLQEKRTALVTRAVTKGLDPNVPLKDSGVEWLGKIPAHWDVKRLKFGAELNPSPLELRKLSQDREVSFVPMEAVGEFGGLDLSRTKPLSDVGSGYTYFADGDVIVAKITPCFENGKGALATGLANGIGFGTTELHVLRAIGGLERKYLFYLTLADAFRRLGKAEMYGAGGQKRVPESFVKNVRHPIPPIHEQRAIAAFLDRETAQIDALIAKIREGMERLKEFRTALISAAVTGKIDVREEAARSAVA
jgi:type I restriction enzyme S subunit